MVDPRQVSDAGGPHGARRVAWIELFYDLVFVATIVSFSDAVSVHLELDVIVVVVASFAAVWWIWLVTVLLANRFPMDDWLQRLLVLAQMLLLTLVALYASSGFEHHEGFLSVAYGLLCVDVAVMYGRHVDAPATTGAVARARRNEFAVAALPLFAAGFVDGPARYVLWGIALLTIVLPSLLYLYTVGRAEPRVEEHHLVERFGLLTIIVFGESFVKVALLASEGRLHSIDAIVLGALFVLVFAMWWSYFDDFPDAGLPDSSVRLLVWFFGHFWFQVFVVGVAVGYGELLQIDLGSAVDLDRTLITVAPLVGAFLALALLGTCTRRVPMRPTLLLRLGAAAVVAIAGVAIYEIDEIDVEGAAILLAVLALAQAALAARLRRHTRVLPAP